MSEPAAAQAAAARASNRGWRMGKFALAAAAAAVALVSPAAVAETGHPPHPESAPHTGPGHSWSHDGPYDPEPGYGHPRLQVGERVHPMLLSPRYHVRDWPAYRLHHPAPGHRWVRFYGDAYLVDEDGWIRHARYGIDWDREAWVHEDRIPFYAEEDAPPAAYEHRWSVRHGYRPYGWGPPGHGGHPLPPLPGYGHPPAPGHWQAWYGVPCGYCAPFVTVVETTVTPITTFMVEEIVEEEVVETRRAAKKRPVRRPPPPPPPPPPARAGERG